MRKKQERTPAEKITRKLTNRIFENTVFSSATDRAKDTVSAKLLEEYKKRVETENPIAAEGALMREYCDAEKAAELGGMNKEDIAAMTDTQSAVGEISLKRRFRHARAFAWVFGFAFTYFLIAAVNFAIIGKQVYAIFGAVMLAAAVLSVFGCRRKMPRYKTIRLTPQAYENVKLLSDRYVKRTLNSLYAASAALFILVLSDGLQYLKSGIKAYEMWPILTQSINIFQLTLLIFIKNLLCEIWINGALRPEKRAAIRKTILWISGLSAAYLGAGICATTMVYLIAPIYLAGCVIYNLTLRRSLTYINIRVNYTRAVAVTLCVALSCGFMVMKQDKWFLTPMISRVMPVEYAPDSITYDDERGVYTITTEKETFKILQLTDIHLGGSATSVYKDYRALNACYDIILYTKPDLVIVTGDLVYPMAIMSFSLNNSSPIIQFAAFMRNVGIPWAFTYGNHDTENMASMDERAVDEMLKSLSYKTSRSLLYPYVKPDIYGRANQLIELRNADGSLRQALFLIDSNDYTGAGLNDYDYIHDDQVDWYVETAKALSEEEGRKVPSLIFFHIPLQQYKTAYELYMSGSKSVEYFFGENNETMMDKVCCSDYPSELFNAAVKLGAPTAMFCGHDHYNNMSLKYRGIRLTYGMSIDYLVMPGIDTDTAQRGGTLISVERGADEVKIEQIPLEKIRESD